LRSLLTALVTKTRPPQTTGLECARPGIAVRQRTFSPVFGSQRSGRFCRSATPEACGPRKEGQLPAAVFGAGRAGGRAPAVLSMRRAGFAFAAPAGAHVLRSRIMRRGVQSSVMREKLTRPPSARAR
jgi:hypothetical protein